MIKSKTLFKVGTGLAAIVSAIAFTTTPTLASKKPAIEVVTHAGAGGGTDVNSRMMMLRSRRTLKQDMVVVNKRGGGGADISPLRTQNVPLIGFIPDSQRYFKYHHTPIDNFEAVNQRELEMGVAAMTSLIYLIDQYGL